MIHTQPLTAIVLAGGQRDEVCRDDPAAINKAFVHVGGAPLVTHALRALREAASIHTIIAVTPNAAPKDALMLADERRESGERFQDSLANGLQDLDADTPVLLCASDLPALTPMAVDDFVERAVQHDCDIAYGYLDQALHDVHYPHIRHTWARFREGVFCGTGLCLIRPRALPALLQIMHVVTAARKNPWRLASLFGPKILMHYALGILSIHEVEDRASIILGCRARGIASNFPESAINIDRYSDLQLHRNV